MKRKQKKGGKAQPHRGYPKGLKIVEEGQMFKLFKFWKNKIADEPFIITDSAQDVLDNYELYCRKWKFKPDLKTVKTFINKHQQEQ